MTQKPLNSPGSIGGGSGTQLGGAIGGETGSWWSLEEGPDSWRPKPAARRERLIISLKRKLQKWEQRTCNNSTPTTKYRSRKALFIMLQGSRLRPFFENVRVQIWRCRICASAWSALLKESAILHKARAAEPYSFLLINVIQASLSLAVLLLCFSLRIMNPSFKQLF